MSKYYLTHVTTENNCKNIVNTNEFWVSKHTQQNIQWLGDGIYFWSANEKDAIRIGKKLVTHKKENRGQNTNSISIMIDVDDDNYMNLDENKWETQFYNFAKKIDSENILLKLLESNKNQQNLSSKELNRAGRVFGDCVNLFVKVLKKNYDIEIYLVSHYFYHRYRKNLLFGREELCYQQFCVKNPNLVNGVPSVQWDIE